MDGLILCFRSLLTLLHSERPKLHTILAFLSAIGLTIFQLYPGDVKIMKDGMQWNPI